MAVNIADKKNNNLPLWGNEKTMNLNNLILTNILSSHYFKVNLYELKTYHEVIDEIYYKVTHLEPWEKGSRVTAGQTGMCGGVRGVGAGGIVSTSFCILYKLFTLKLTRKQVVGLINHTDSPYIRALGFMYIRYTQPPADLWDWYEPYLDDDEKIDVKAGGGKEMTMGEMLQHFLSKLEWFSTLFPRIPVPIQKQIERNLSEWRIKNKGKIHTVSEADNTREISPKRNHLEDKVFQNSYKNGEFKHNILESVKDSRYRRDSGDERDRERKQRHERERYEKSKYHYSGHSSRGRSRSPPESRSYREERGHHSEYKNSSSSDHHRHRNPDRVDKVSRNRRHSPDHSSRSHSHDRHSDLKHSHKRHHHHH